MIGPVRDQKARDALDDFGVFDDDRTEVLTSRKPPAGTEGSQSELPTTPFGKEVLT